MDQMSYSISLRRLVRAFFCSTGLLFVIWGCSTSSQNLKKAHDQEVMIDAVKTVAESVGGREMSDQDMKNLIRDIRTDPDTRSAVEAIQSAVNPQSDDGRIKFSPATGKRYAPHMEYDPETGVKLEYVQ
jgi:beta-xylosidase